MNYQTFEPIDELRPFVKCYWTLEHPAETPPQSQTIVPDACMEMIFHYGDLFRQYTRDGEAELQPGCFVFGQLTQPLIIEPTGTTGIFSVRFQPEGFWPFITMPVKEMDDRAVPLDQLFGQKGSELAEKILHAGVTTERIKHIETFLLRQLTTTKTIDAIVQATVATMLATKGQLSIGDISTQSKINRRQLERRFTAAIGLSPKQLSRTIRLQSILQVLLSKDYESLTALAYEGAYYDQAHFIKDFKEFTGLTPGEFFGEHLEMSRLFYKKK